MNKKGFIFVETIVVTVVLLGSLITLYSLYASSVTTESRRLRYDDTAKLYETFYLEKYLESFNLDLLKENILSPSKPSYEILYRSRGDFMESYANEELRFFGKLWDTLHIRNMYLLSNRISDVVACTSNFSSICINTNLLEYLKTLDDGENGTYYLVVEYATSLAGETCSSNDCRYFYANMVVK